MNTLNEELNILDFFGLLKVLYKFIFISLMSILIGVLVGYLYLMTIWFIIKKSEDKINLEICLLIIYGFFAFYLSEIFHLSGLISLFCYIMIYFNYSCDYSS